MLSEACEKTRVLATDFETLYKQLLSANLEVTRASQVFKGSKDQADSLRNSLKISYKATCEALNELEAEDVVDILIHLGPETGRYLLFKYIELGSASKKRAAKVALSIFDRLMAHIGRHDLSQPGE